MRTSPKCYFCWKYKFNKVTDEQVLPTNSPTIKSVQPDYGNDANFFDTVENLINAGVDVIETTAFPTPYEGGEEEGEEIIEETGSPTEYSGGSSWTSGGGSGGGAPAPTEEEPLEIPTAYPSFTPTTEEGQGLTGSFQLGDIVVVIPEVEVTTPQVTPPPTKTPTAAPSAWPTDAPVGVTCDEGFQPNSDDAACVSCASPKVEEGGHKHHYSDEKSKSACKTCPAGSGVSNDRKKCTECPDQWASTNGSACKKCPDYAPPLPGKTACGDGCPEGYVDTSAAGKCDKKCPWGTQPNAGKTACEKCSTGFASPTGLSCNKCKDGLQSNKADSDADVVRLHGSHPANVACELCPAGWAGTGGTCAVECGLNTKPNAKRTNCEACKPGFAGVGTHCTNVDECTANTHDCDDNAKCDDTTGSFTCTCNKGFRGEGKVCENINECLFTTTNDCAVFAQCKDEYGGDPGYTCSCYYGYEGDGKKCKKCTGNTATRSSQHGTKTCIPCPQQWKPNAANSNCEPCQIGQAMKSTGVCERCPTARQDVAESIFECAALAQLFGGQDSHS